MKKLKVLVSENDTRVLFAFSRVLEKEGCICIQSDNTDKTLKELSSSHPNALFLDVSGTADANEKMLKKVKALDLSMPVVIITSHITEEVKKLAESVHALQIIEKPLRLDNVRQCLDRIKSKIVNT